MKKLILLGLFVFNQNLWANNIPKQLIALIPVGAESIRIEGITKDMASCLVDISHGAFGFTATVMVLDKTGQLNSRRFAKFQIGLGHNLMEPVLDTPSALKAISLHEAEELYSSDIRSILNINRSDDTITAVRVTVEKKSFFGFSKKTDEVCRLLL